MSGNMALKYVLNRKNGNLGSGISVSTPQKPEPEVLIVTYFSFSIHPAPKVSDSQTLLNLTGESLLVEVRENTLDSASENEPPGTIEKAFRPVTFLLSPWPCFSL